MVGDHVLSALRALQRDPWHAGINIAGLAVALAAGLLITLYARHELSYDNFVTEPGEVFRVEASYVAPGRPDVLASGAPYRVAEVLNAEMGEQLTATRLARRDAVIETDRGKIRRQIYVGDERLSQVLELAAVEGDAAAAMAKPGAIALTRGAARELFGSDRQVIGRSLRVDGADMYVAAILADPPTNTDRRIEILGSVATSALAFPEWQVPEWGLPAGSTFVRLKDGVSSKAVSAALPALVERHSNYRFDMSLSLRPLRDIHLFAGDGALVTNRNAIALAALTVTGAFLIFIACFSYINLATARSLLRLREVGLRKTLGGTASQLTLQFLIESALVTFIAFAVAFVAAAIALPPFGNLVGRDLALADLLQPGQIAAAVGLLAFVTLAAGGYPSLALARHKPVDLLRDSRLQGGQLLRTGIVSVQFGLTCALMIAATVTVAQLSYLRSMDFGFQKSGLLILPVAPDQAANGRDLLLRDRLADSASFNGASWSVGAPGSDYSDGMSLSRSGDTSGTLQSVLDVFVDDRFFEVYGIRLLAGRSLSDDRGLDRMLFPSPERPVVEASAVLSESAIARLGFASPQAAVGQQVSWNGARGRVDFTVVGVAADIHFRLGRLERQPMMFLPRVEGYIGPGEVAARVRPGARVQALAEAQQVWGTLFPDETFRYEFIEDRISRINAEDSRQSQLIALFSGLALFVACLGLFALASFVTARRAFEVAMRKVLGSTSVGVTRLLMWEFARPILLANVMAWPLAYLLIRPWLERFPHRLELSPFLFLGVSAVALAVAMATVLVKSWKMARARPAQVLRDA